MQIKLSCNLLTTVLLLFFLVVSQCQRRIKHGIELSGQKGFMVYLYQANNTPRHYDYWICGGAAVTELYLITSAACVADSHFTLATTGLKRLSYLKDKNTTDCFNFTTRRVVYTCIPRAYNLDYENVNVWASMDIAIVKVHYRLIFENHDNFQKLCGKGATRVPIPINYDPKYQLPGTDALMYGYGHTLKWRQPHDTRDLNQKTLHYGSTQIIPLKECLKYFHSSMWGVISKYMICTNGNGNMDEYGNIINNKPKQRLHGCSDRNDCHDYIESDIKSVENASGICQNDHGGPLTTFIGSQEVLIGIASVFRVNKNWDCTGPYLFTSTACMGSFIDCNIYPANISNVLRGKICNMSPKDRGYFKIEKFYDWDESNPQRPVAVRTKMENENLNEDVKIRVQRPLH